MKKFVLLVAAFFVLFAGCTQQTTPPNDDNPPIEVPEVKEYTVTFQSNGGTKISPLKVQEGKSASKPKDPTKEGYTFKGWYLGDTLYTFDAKVTKDITLEAHWETPFEDYGMEIIEISLSTTSVSESEYYTSMEEVGAYIYTFHKLPSNFKTKAEFKKSDYTKENKLSTGGDIFYNREGLLPAKKGRTYTECDIDYTGGSRNAKRIVFSSDFLIFYTNTHYSSFYILRFHE